MGSERKIQNENIHVCIQLKSNQRPLTGVIYMLYDTCLVTWQLTACRIRYFPWNKHWSIDLNSDMNLYFCMSMSVWTILEINLSYFKLYCCVWNRLWLDVDWIWLFYKSFWQMMPVQIIKYAVFSASLLNVFGICCLFNYRTWTCEIIINLIHVLSFMLILIICQGSIRVKQQLINCMMINCQIVLGASLESKGSLVRFQLETYCHFEFIACFPFLTAQLSPMQMKSSMTFHTVFYVVWDLRYD